MHANVEKMYQKNQDVLCLKIKYNIVSYPNFIFFIFDFQYFELKNNKAQISKLIEDRIILNLDDEYKLSGIISVPSFNHYKTIIFNPIGLSINTNFNPSKIYHHDGSDNNGKITEIDENMN